VRRISLNYAQPGMTLSTDLYDSYGRKLLPGNTRLSADHISALARLGTVGELFIHDPRVDDVVVGSLVSPATEGAAVRELAHLVAAARSVACGREQGQIDLSSLHRVALSIVRELFPAAIGEPDIRGWFALADYDHVHPVKVAQLSLLVGHELGLDPIDLQSLGMAALLENLGYVLLPPRLLEQPRQFTDEELKAVRAHPGYGAALLKRYASLDDEVLQAVLQHHERWNGSGYPSRLKGENTSVLARIIGMVDSCCALASARPHREMLLPHEAIEFIMAYSGELFDPRLVDIFVELVPLYPTGVMVQLNTGEAGIISESNTGIVARPTIRICYDKDLRSVVEPFDLDLSEAENQTRLITRVLEY